MEEDGGFSIFKNLIIRLFRDIKIRYSSQKNVDNRKQQVIVQKQLIIQGDFTKEKKEIAKEFLDLPQNVEPRKISEEKLYLNTKNNSKEENFLKQRLEENKENQLFFLGFKELLFIYNKRTEIDFTKDELVFLIKSSFYNDFPYWYWSYLYREKFGNIIPAYSDVFKVESLIIRIKTIKALSRFTNTDEIIINLAETEYDENVLAEMIIVLGKNKNEELISRLIANIISRRLLPQIHYKELPKIKISLSENEKQYLYNKIKSGRDLEKINALNILSIAANESDLPILEEALKKEKYLDIALSVLNCIKKIGKINNLETIIDNIKNSKREDEFLLSLDIYSFSSDKSLLEMLYDWLINGGFASNRFSSFIDSWQYNRKIEETIVSLCDKDFYEYIIDDLKSRVERRDSYLYTWSHFNLLKSLNKNKEILKLLREEKRLISNEQWKEVVDEMDLNEAVLEGKNKILDLASSKNYQLSMFALRKLWEIIPSNEAIKYEYKIKELRGSLENKLVEITKIGCSENLNQKAKNGLDYFLGENRSFYRNYPGRDYKYKPDSIKNKKDIEFYKLWEDIGWFDSIEKEFIKHTLGNVNDESEKFLISQIGKPHKEIYDNINVDWQNIESISEKLKLVREKNLNPMIILKAIEALNRINIESKDELRHLALDIYNEYKTKHQKNSKKIEYDFVYGASFRTLVQFGDINDLVLVDEYVKKEVVFKRIYYYYSHFHDCDVMNELYSEYLLAKKSEEKKDIIWVLETIDNNWSKKILQIDN